MNTEPNKLYRMTDQQYRALDAANYSTLKHVRESALAMRAAMSGAFDPCSEAVKVGRAVDAIFAGTFDDSFYPAPTCDRRTKAGKEAYETATIAAEGRELIGEEMMFVAHAMANNTRANPDAAKLLGGTMRQICAVWDDADTGVRCKGKIDAMTPGVCLTDLKTTRVPLTPGALGREVASRGYHIQAAFYTDGFRACTGIDTPFVLVFVQNREPYDVAVYRLDDAAIDAGRKWYKRALAMYKHGRETNQWPGVPAGIGTLEIPKWELQAAESAAWSPEVGDDEHPF